MDQAVECSILRMRKNGGVPCVSYPTWLRCKFSQGDGRRQRIKRTRQALIDGYLRLLRRNPTMPTASQIAEEAGCSVRSVFERFTDLDALGLVFSPGICQN